MIAITYKTTVDKKGEKTMIIFSSLMLILGFFGLITGIVLVCIKKTRKAGIITTISSVVLGTVFFVTLVFSSINAGVESTSQDDSGTDSSGKGYSYYGDGSDEDSSDDTKTEESDEDVEKASEEKVKETRQKASENEKTLRYGDLIKSDKYNGEPYHITKGKVFQADESADGTTLLVYLTDNGDDDWDDLILVKYQIGETDAIEDDYIEVFGSLEERTTYETKIGGENTVPTLNASEVKIVK